MIKNNNTDNTSINRTKIIWKQKFEERQLYGHFKRQKKLQEKTWASLRKENLKKETEFLVQQNNRCRLCGNRNETIDHIVSEHHKLAQKEYKTRNDWMGKVINLELCKKFKFDYMNKWYIHKPESILENEMHKLFGDVAIQTEYLISARRSDLVKVNKKKREPAKL